MSLSLDDVHFDENGLLPAIVQDALTGEVLMLAYMNEESLVKTLDTGETYFWSRSRSELWHKGATSGHVQRVIRIAVDCDGDALLVQVEQEGAACHTGHRSCFYTEATRQPGSTLPLSDTLGRMMRVIHSRFVEMPESSYTTTLFRGGTDRILKKIGEEAGEVIIATKNHKTDEIAWEVSDLVYHLLVLLENEGVPFSAITAELEKRGKPKTDSK
jgi:phosphoribosyl-ATP pyrophosphohydrolase/phosphoribosyl-AMP cyclohydrolase